MIYIWDYITISLKIMTTLLYEQSVYEEGVAIIIIFGNKIRNSNDNPK